MPHGVALDTTEGLSWSVNYWGDLECDYQDRRLRVKEVKPTLWPVNFLGANPDAPEPKIRLSQAKMALEHLLAIGGSAHLPMRMVANYVEARSLHLVMKAPVIKRHAYAVSPLRSEKIELISEY